MQFPESWLREFCNPALSTAELADVLTMAGLEVEELRPVAPAFTQVVVAEIKDAQPHPNADRLRVCQVDAGQGSLLTIVCGAPNARVGIRVPCALVGAQLPTEPGAPAFVIKVGKLRGVESQGMLCSARELGLSQDHAGLLELAHDAVVGQNIREHLNLDDTLLTLKLTPNLAHCLSVYGVARELSALTGAPLKTPVFSPVPVKLQDKLPITVEAADLCGRFSGRVVRGVNAKAPTPAWMVDRLQRCGQRSVSALVDISNYVMFELGRPSHIFDLDKIHGGLHVRWGRAGEQLKLLNGNTITLDEQVGVIADAKQVESLAGIMGGDSCAVGDETHNIYVEAAFWWPRAIAGRSRRYNFSTDAGHRFERGVDPEYTVEHIERITQLILEICGGEAGPMDDHRVNMPQPKTVNLRVSRAAKVIGMPVTSEQCLHSLQRLGLTVTQAQSDSDVLNVMSPSYRFDIALEEDLIEEVARVVGYHLLPVTAPLAPVTPKLRSESERSPFEVRRLLAAAGYQETINFSFVDARWEHELAGNTHPIELLNPIASQMNVMRSSLMGSLLNVLKFNVDRKASRVRVFELGRVFMRDPAVQDSLTTVAGIHQPMRVAALAWGSCDSTQWGAEDRPVDFFDVKGDVQALLAPCGAEFKPAHHPALHPGRCAQVSLNGRSIGVLGELHPRWRQQWGLNSAPILFELELDAVLQRRVAQFVPVSKLQSVARDIAVVVPDGVSFAQLEQAIRRAPTQGWLRDFHLFDVYRPSAQKNKDDQAQVMGGSSSAVSLSSPPPVSVSMAIRLNLHSDVVTLTEEQIESVVHAVVQQLQTEVGVHLRTS